MKLNVLKNSQLAVIGGLAMLAVCATTAKADGAQTGFYLSGDSGLNELEQFHHISTEPGLRFDLDAGYGFSLAPQLTLGAELETGFIYNNLRIKKTGGEDDQIPLLGNLVLNYHLGKFVPYVGAGIGGDYSALSAGEKANYSNVDPAIQAEAGVRYEVCDHFEVGLGYKYLADFVDRDITISENAFLLSATYHF